MVDFSLAPQQVVWESTRACALACVHCRSDADLSRHPEELTTAEGKRLIDQIRELGALELIVSGGDPLNRRDLEELLRYGKAAGLRLGVVPAASLNLTRERLAALKDAGADLAAFSLDGATASSHDSFRRVPGAFDRIVSAAGWARGLGLPFQINTSVGAWNRLELDALAGLVARLGAAAWEVSFLIPVGRGAKLGGLTPEQFLAVFAALAVLVRSRPFLIKLVEGQQFRRFNGQLAGPRPPNAGDGLLFVDHRGDICPSAVLPLSRGNVRVDGLAATYRHDSLFTGLRDRSRLKGRCGVCDDRQACGGSRARAWAMTGDAWAEDPSCAFRRDTPR